jgi:hypothetical protein
VREAVVLSGWDWWPRADRARPRGKGLRRGLIAGSLVAGLALGAALLPVASPWTTRPDLGERQDDARATRADLATGGPAAAVLRPVGGRTVSLTES